MSDAVYRSRILLFATAVLGLAGVTASWLTPPPHELPDAPSGVIHGEDAWDLAMLRRVRPDATIAPAPAKNAPFYGDLVSADEPATGFEKPPERHGDWWVSTTDTIVEARRTLTLAGAQVDVLAGGKVLRACARQGAKFQCAPEEWFYVGPAEEVIGGKKTRCTWAHPLRGETIRITFPNAKGAWTARFGIRDGSVGQGAPVQVRASRGTQTWPHRHSDRRGWTTLAIPDGDGPLVLEISANDIARRHFCFTVEAS